MLANEPEGLSFGLTFDSYLVYMIILHLSNGAPMDFVIANVVPYTKIYPKGFFSLGFSSPKPFLFLFSITFFLATEEMLKKPDY